MAGIAMVASSPSRDLGPFSGEGLRVNIDLIDVFTAVGARTEAGVTPLPHRGGIH
jgi:hypothetical protein